MSLPELGSKISLISKADIRYEGRLFTVDPQECTIALANGEFLLIQSVPQEFLSRMFSYGVSEGLSRAHQQPASVGKEMVRERRKSAVLCLAKVTTQKNAEWKKWSAFAHTFTISISKWWTDALTLQTLSLDNEMKFAYFSMFLFSFHGSFNEL